MLVTNFPNDRRDRILAILHHLERPVQLVFLIIAGAAWAPDDWRGWVLVPLFVAGRLAGKYVGVLASRAVVGAVLPTRFVERRQLVTPMSGLAIALVVSVPSLGGDLGLSWVVTAVIGGAVGTELLVQRTQQPDEPAPLDESTRVPIDELDDDDSGGVAGPIYRDDSEPHRLPRRGAR
jgi:hypothetical protein